MSTTNNRLTAEELQKLRQTDFSKKPGFVKAETVLAKEVGEVGTPDKPPHRVQPLPQKMVSG